ncbi:phosphotransferase [Embleya sp. NPDC056575]|uniref:phosphotransferase n=1 Tax=unclassified Embleya TaxID=2699296 RepID=UPI003698279C
MKASPDSHAAAEYVRREAAITPCVPGLAPELIAAYDTGGWVATLTAYQKRARFADLAPGSPDLPRVARALFTVKRSHPGPRLPYLFDRWATRPSQRDRRSLHGAHLLHTNLHPTNLMVYSEPVNPRVCVIGWGRAAVGPMWAELALFYRELRRANHTPADALAWLARIPAWRTALPERVDALARGMRSATTSVQDQAIWAELIA